VAEALGMNATVDIDTNSIVAALQHDPVYAQRAKDMGLCLVQGSFFFYQVVDHKFASDHWEDGSDGYLSWKEALGRLQNITDDTIG
jgi:hypothetical protein